MLFRFHTRQGRLLSYALAFFTMALFATASYAQSDEEKQLEKLKQTIANLKKELEATKSDRDEVNKVLESTEIEIGDLSKKAKKIESKLEERQQKLNTLKDERSQLNEHKKTQEKFVSNYVAAAYRLGQQSNLRLLLNQEDPTRVSRNLKYYDYLVTARAEKISDYVSTIERINKIEPEISYQRDLVRSDLNNLKKRQSQLSNAQDKRKRTLALLESKISGQDSRLRSKLRDRQELEKILSKVIQNIADIKPKNESQPFATLKGKLPWPTKGHILKKFGSQRVANKMRWEGMLIASAEGTPVHAVHYGRVIFADYLRGHGLLIIIDHGNDFLSLYAHNQTLYKTLGEWVDSKETIASVGNSGGQRDTALYFELRYKGKPTNPQKWFRRA